MTGVRFFHGWSGIPILCWARLQGIVTGPCFFGLAENDFNGYPTIHLKICIDYLSSGDCHQLAVDSLALLFNIVANALDGVTVFKHSGPYMGRMALKNYPHPLAQRISLLPPIYFETPSTIPDGVFCFIGRTIFNIRFFERLFGGE